MAKATDRAVITRALDFCLAEIQPCKSHPWGFASVHGDNLIISQMYLKWITFLPHLFHNYNYSFLKGAFYFFLKTILLSSNIFTYISFQSFFTLRIVTNSKKPWFIEVCTLLNAIRRQGIYSLPLIWSNIHHLYNALQFLYTKKNDYL